MSSQDIDYFLQRARDEREAARRAPGTHIAEIHLELAREYEALAKSRRMDHPVVLGSAIEQQARPAEA